MHVARASSGIEILTVLRRSDRSVAAASEVFIDASQASPPVLDPPGIRWQLEGHPESRRQ